MEEPQLQIQAVPGLFPLNWPMGLTMLRLLLLPLFLWVILVDVRRDTRAGIEPHHLRWLAVGIFVVMAASDKLDGYLARRLHQTSKIGALLDPVADKILIACSIILLSFNFIAPAGFEIPVPVVLAIYGKDLVVVVGAIALLSLTGRASLAARTLGKWSTALQLVLILTTLLAADLYNVNERLALILTRGLWWLVSLVSVASCVDYLIAGIAQYDVNRARILPGKK